LPLYGCLLEFAKRHVSILRLGRSTGHGCSAVIAARAAAPRASSVALRIHLESVCIPSFSSLPRFDRVGFATCDQRFLPGPVLLYLPRSSPVLAASLLLPSLLVRGPGELLLRFGAPLPSSLPNLLLPLAPMGEDDACGSDTTMFLVAWFMDSTKKSCSTPSLAEVDARHRLLGKKAT